MTDSDAAGNKARTDCKRTATHPNDPDGDCNTPPTADAPLRTDGAGAIHQDAPGDHLPPMDDVTRFRIDILRAIDAAAKPIKGLAVKARLEEFYGTDVNHGRLYPNLDGLVDEELITKSERDKRTNEYSLTEYGEALLDRRREWLGGDA